MKQSYITSNAILYKNQSHNQCDVFDSSSGAVSLNWRNRVALLAISLTLFLAATNVHAQGVCDYVAPIQVHYIPIAEDQMFDFFTTVFPGYENCLGPGFDANNPNPNCALPANASQIADVSYPMNRYFSIGIAATNTIIYYDHWEDGYEIDLENPVQTTTEIWGDGDLTNGVAPGYPSDIFSNGDVVAIESIITGPPNAGTILYDGRDKLASSFTVTMTHFYYPTNLEGTPWALIAGAAPILASDEFGTDFTLPIGEDQPFSQLFEHVGAFIQAGEAGATVDVDLDGNGTTDITYNLGQGETAFINGGLEVGAKITSDNPITAQMQASDICSNYSTRSFLLFPDDQLSNAYVATVGTPDLIPFDPPFTDEDASTYVFLYNPNGTAIVINWETSAGPQTPITIPAGGQIDVLIPNTSGALFQSVGGEVFNAISAIDAVPEGIDDCEDYFIDAHATWDWGYALIPMDRVGNQIPVVALAPGSDPRNDPITDNSAPVWLTAFYPPGSSSVGNITICVDFNGDGGAFTDVLGNDYDQSFILSDLQSFRLYDPDRDNSGTRIWVCDGGDALVTAAWGEDPNTAVPGEPSLDLGTTIIPGPSFQPTKQNELVFDADGDGLFDIDVDTTEYCICVINTGALSYNSLDLLMYDSLVAELSYVENSAYTIFGGIQTPITDEGAKPFPLDENGFRIPFSMNPNDAASLCYSVTLNALPAAGGNVVLNEAIGSDGRNSVSPESRILVDTCILKTLITAAGTCEGDDLTLIANNIDGVGPYTYNWTGPNAFSSAAASPVIPGLAPINVGTYNVTVTDSEGCIATSELAVTTGELFYDIDAVNPDCEGNLGSIDITVSSGVGPYTYYWEQDGVPITLADDCSNGQFSFFDMEPIAGNQPTEAAINAEMYQVQGAMLSVSPPILNGAGTTLDEDNIENTHLNTIYALRTGYSQTIQGGVSGANVTRTWSFSDPVCNATMFFNDLDRNDEVIINASLAGGAPLDLTGAFTIADPANTCVSYTATNTWTSTCVPPTPNLNNSDDGGFFITFPGCIDEIEIIFYDRTDPNVGGTDGGSYSVSFEPICDYTEDYSDLDPGTYTIVVTDANGCVGTQTVVLQEPNCNCDLGLTADVVQPNCDGSLGSIDITITNGAPPYAYDWVQDNAPYPLDPTCSNGQQTFFDFCAVENQSPTDFAINNETYIVQGATLTVSPPMPMGGATTDEDVINDSHLGGLCALRTGLEQTVAGSAGGQNMTRIWTFSQPVCDLNMFFNDLDRNDEVIINASLAGGAPIDLTSAFTIADPANTCVAYTGSNTWRSTCPPPAANLNNSDDGGFFLTFPSCIDEIEIIFYDYTNPNAGGTDGGSYSVNFENTCDYVEDLTDLNPGDYTLIVTDSLGCVDTLDITLEVPDCVFDLALTKTLATGQDLYISPGDTISFDVTVTNQDTSTAYNVLVNDYVPTGYTFDTALNPTWNVDSDGDGNPDQTIAGPVVQNQTVTLPITLIVNDPYTGTQDDLVNVAEIASFEDIFGNSSTDATLTDIDSAPDTTPNNDAGGTPGGPDDDFTDGDGTGTPGDSTATTDEDDEDPAFVTIFDLALTKMLSAGQSPYIAPGDVVSFDITVYNDGTVPAYNTLVNDYVPAGYTYDPTANPLWEDADADGNPDQTIAGPIAPGTTTTLTIQLIVNNPFTGTQDDLVNSTEISASDDDTNPNNDPPIDADSTPDNVDGNDAGGTPGGPDDDFTDGDGTGTPGDSTATTDEDDEDPAFVTIFDLALTKMLSAGQSPYIAPGDVVSFDITVYNDGTVPAYNTLVNDYVPAGYTYDPTANPLWGDADADGNPDQTIAGPIAPGDTETLTILLMVNDPFTGTQDDLVNSAEISASDDDTDPNNPPPTDSDSTPDNVDGNDAGGTPGGPDDDFTDGDGTGTPGDSTAATDEDDEDPAFVSIFDLALTKMLSAGQSPYIAPGDVVSFDITVYNDGTVPAYNTLVNDYVPAGYTYDAALNPTWEDADTDGNPDQIIAGPIAPGDTETLTILLMVNDPFTGTQDDLVNSAEISASDDDTDPNNAPPIDADSTPDNVDGNDAGGTPNGPDDDFTDGDGTGAPGDSTAATDEDDEDPAFVSIFDLALTKMLSAGQSPYIAPGDTVSFDITVYNDGTVPAYNTLVNDYVPAGYTYDTALNPAWGDADADGNPDQTIAGPIAPGTTTTLTIQLIVNNPFTGTQDDLVNSAEISASDDDTDPNNPPPTDSDSTPDNVDGNDAGGTPGGPDDDFTGGDGTGTPGDSTAATDEDDEDPAFVTIFDLALTKSLSVGQEPFAAPGDTVSFDIEVFNQGTVPAYNTLVNDYLPAGYVFDAALNPAWSADSDGEGNPDITIAGPVAPGTSTVVALQVIILNPFTANPQTDLTNIAEISAIDDDTDPNNNPPIDYDSTPDIDPANDAGGTPDGPDDDFVDGDGTGMPLDSIAATDEDDSDPAYVSLFDLALTKTPSAGQSNYVAYGDTVTFDITVVNQAGPAYNILVNDYVPAGYIFDAALNPAWGDADADGNPDQSVFELQSGQDSTMVITLIVNDASTISSAADLTNVAEISDADDDTNPNNNPPTDSDSTPDNDPTNDAGGTPGGPDDDFTDGDGTGAPGDNTAATDEDDSDPALFDIFDLALDKMLSPGQSPYIQQGGPVSYDITVHNQGTVDVLDVLVNDYVPTGMTFDAALNPTWGDTDADGNPDTTIVGPIPAGGFTTVTIILTVDNPYTGTPDALTNYAEIASADDDGDPSTPAPSDVDSTPDNDPANDAGGTPDGSDDNFVDGDGTGTPLDGVDTTDEDDADPTTVEIFDLALQKRLSVGQDQYVAPGDVVSFDITVSNQGFVDAYDVLVNDYVPSGYTYDPALNLAWGDTDADGNPDRIITGPIIPGATSTIQIRLIVNDPYITDPDALVNYAEIGAADDDQNPTNDPPLDFDSDWDNDPVNDAGGTPGGPDDDFIDGDASGLPLDSMAATDEDDQDPAFISIFDLALTKSFSPGQSNIAAPGAPMSFDITVYNQGSVAAYDVLVNDYIPSGYTYDPAANPTWGDADADGNPDQTVAGPIAPGGTATLTIVLTVNNPFLGTVEDLINVAEISSADDDGNPNTPAPDDVDSTPNNDPTDDAGGEPDSPSDDSIGGDGSGAPGDEDPLTDEDDQDPVLVDIFDLALSKSLAAGQSEYIAPGDTVNYEFTLYNQGTTLVYNTLVNDFVPAGMTFDPALNTEWGDADLDGNPDRVIVGPLAPGSSQTFLLSLIVNDPFTGTSDDLTNYAEIAGSDNDDDTSTPPPTDIDSTPNNDPTDDAGGTPGGPDDDFVDGNGTGMPNDSTAATDEDDQDPALVNVFDLALTKSLSAGQGEYIAPGDTVSFDMTVYNQGTADAYNVLVNDYVPAGMTFDAALNPTWSADSDGDGNPDQVVAGPILPNTTQVITILLIVNDPFAGTSADLVNVGEIGAADDDTDPTNTPPTDYDSTPDTDPANDAGGTPDGPEDDFVDGDGSGAPLDGVDTTDEDDQDPAFVNIFDLALTKTLSAGQDVYITPGDVVSYDITVINQGTIDAYNTLVNDYIPAGMTFDPAANPAWGDADADGNPDQIIAGPLAPGATMTLTIELMVNDPFIGIGDDLVNIAEISAADDDTDPNNTPPTEADSTPDNDPTNDPGNTPGGPDDDAVDGDGTGMPQDSTAATDEDDSDPALVSVFDLALAKTLSAGQDPYIAPGDVVSFDITVYNQGTVNSYDVLVNDYIPAGMTFDAALNPTWGDADADGNPDQTVAGPIAPGASEVLTIQLIINNPFAGTQADLVNIAEISAADDDGDPNTPPPTDIDSTPNNNPTDDAGGTPGGPDDDFVDGDGTGTPGDSIDTTDEDDQDPSFVSIFDLALTKALSTGQSPYIAPGDNVSFDIVVTNQGTVNSYNTLVNDYVPAGYTFDPALNAAWGDADADGNPDQTIAGPVAPGGTETLTIVLTVNDPFTGTADDLVNVVEISASDDDTDPTNTPPTEADSTPDNTSGNDAGGEPNSPSDNVVDGDGSGVPGDTDPTTDEDDSDPAVANIFDLALTKSLAPGASPYVSPGDVVTYSLTVINQGTVDAYDVLVNDYIPAGLTFDAAANPAWGDADADGNPDQTIAGPLAPGATMTLNITLTVNDPFTGNGDDLVNSAEISAADDDGDPNTPAPPDADSTPDNDPNNDPGGTPGGPDDDAVDGNGTGMPGDSTATTDEDDQDPAVLSIFDLALTKSLSAGESPYLREGDTISYDITVTNQGTVDAVNILVNEYIPSGLNFDFALNPMWGNADADTNPDQVIAGPLAPGASEVITIQLIVDNPFTGLQEDLINFAEISNADDDGDPNTLPPQDTDSTPDNDPTNDAGGTPGGPDDDAVDGDGSGLPQDGTNTTDEDDHDPTFATIFDLSLIKTLSLGQSQYIAPGDVVSFDVTVINDGLVDAYNVLVNDYVPNGYTYDPALNPGWADADADGNPDRTIIGPIIPGGTVTSTIVLTVNDPFDASTMSLVNYGEISDADDDLDPNNDPPIDTDSTPDNDPTNDAGGTPGGPDDDATGGDGSGIPLDGDEITDEDDHDPATVSIFDLALIKSLSAGQSSAVGAGDNVSFDITVINQGTVDAYDILVNDYVPSGYTFDVALNPDWADFDLDGNPDQIVAGPLAPGATQVLTIVLTVNNPFDGTAADLTNLAEISSADDDGEVSTPAPDDVDSTPDNDPNNDPGGTPDGPDDDAIGGDGSGLPNDGNPATDEDDSDPATVDIFDMALTKSLSPGQSQFVVAGDTVSFDITLFNQGTIDAQNILVNDYVPAGYTFDAALNPQWGDSDLDGNPDRIITGPLQPGTNFSFEILLIINNPFNGTPDDLVNVAEITEADDDGNPATPPPSDIDSNPDNDPTNDPGGTPNGPDDDAIDGNGTGTPQDGVAATDEDDSDPATVVVGGFDLALTKSLSAGQSPYVGPGDNVSFDITVINQGAIDAYNILVNDYLPAGYTFNAALNAGWSTDSDGDGNPDQTIAGALVPGDTEVLTIVLTVNDPFTGTAADLVNIAEISAADNDTDPTNDPPTDTDSTPDTNPTNDPGGEPGSPSDDSTGGDGTGNPGDTDPTTDEDDSDPAIASIFDLALTKTVSAGQATNVVPGDIVSYDITVINQGTVDAYNIEVNDYTPTGMVFDIGLNPGWGDTDANGIPEYTIAGPLAPGTTQVISIQLMVANPFDPTTMSTVNFAEIGTADDDGNPNTPPPMDTDSTPNDDPTDDAGGEPGSPSDDATGGDGSGTPGDTDPTADEDDSDPAEVSVATFDLALMKSYSTYLDNDASQAISPGDDICYNIEVFNQGTVDATDVVVTDYIPTGMMFIPFFNTDFSGTPPAVTASIPLVRAGTSESVEITLRIDPGFSGFEIINDAEITDFDNEYGLPDEDSTPGDNRNTPSETGSDDDIDDDCSCAPGSSDNPLDNDDYDPAVIEVQPVLPIELSYFKGTEEDCEVILRWGTASEVNVSHFEIEKSTDGLTFSMINRLEPLGGEGIATDYTYTDTQISAVNYYRLKVVDLDGSTEYSDILTIQANCALGVFISDVFPNPVVNQLVSVRFNSIFDHQAARVVVTDMLGRKMMEMPITVFDGSNLITIDPSGLPAATYVLIIEGNDWRSSAMRFVKLSE